MKHFSKLLTLFLCILAIGALCMSASAAAGQVTGQLSAQAVSPGDTVTFTVSMKETTVSSLGVTVTCDGAFEIISGQWLKNGLMASYDTSKHKGVFSPGGAAAISGDIFQVTLMAKTNAASGQNISVTVIGKNGADTVFEETVSQTVTVGCAAHSWDSGKVTSEATCSKAGVKTYTCTGCGATKTETIQKLAHTYDNACDSACNVCGATRTAGHTYGTAWTSDSADHWHTCSACGAVKDKAPHIASGWIVDQAATELSAGSRHTECTGCGKTLKTETIAATGCKHTGSTSVKNAADATCEKNGYTGDTVCDLCGTVLQQGAVIKATGHNGKIVNQKTATCQEAGYTGDECCAVCNTILKKGAVISKLVHTLEITGAKAASCTEEGFTGRNSCTVCGETTDAGAVIPKIPHVYEDGVCSQCGHTLENHTPSTEPSVPNTTPSEPTIPPTTPTEPSKPHVTLTVPAAPDDTTPSDPEPEQPFGVVGIAAAAAVIGILLLFIFKRKKRK